MRLREYVELHNGLKSKLVTSKSIKEAIDPDLTFCDQCDDEVYESELFTTLYGENLCEYCWDQYINSERGLVEYVPLIASGESKVSDYDAEQLSQMAEAWAENKDDFDLDPIEIERIEKAAIKAGFIELKAKLDESLKESKSTKKAVDTKTILKESYDRDEVKMSLKEFSLDQLLDILEEIDADIIEDIVDAVREKKLNTIGEKMLEYFHDTSSTGGGSLLAAIDHCGNGGFTDDELLDWFDKKHCEYFEIPLRFSYSSGDRDTFIYTGYQSAYDAYEKFIRERFDLTKYDDPWSEEEVTADEDSD